MPSRDDTSAIDARSDASDEQDDTASLECASSFFVGVARSPRLSDTGEARSTPPFHRMLTVGAQSDYHIDYVAGSFPRVRVALIWRRVVWRVAALSAFLLAFCGVAYRGIALPQGGSVELYNAISGFLMALLEMLVGLVMQEILAVNLVYLHNALWLAHNLQIVSMTSRVVRSAALVLFPVVMLLLLTNSLRSLQASQSTVGFERIMTSEDLVRAKTEETATLPATIPLGILQNALTGTSVPFAIATASTCAAATPNALRFNIHDLDATNVVYGFAAQEWNLEVLRNAINLTAEVAFGPGAMNSTKLSESTKGFDLGRAFNLYMHGKILLDKGVNAGSSRDWSCGDPMNEGQRCSGMRDTLDRIGLTHKSAELRTPTNLVDVLESSLAKLIPGSEKPEVAITLQNRSVTKDLRVELMTVQRTSLIPGENITINGTDGNVYKFESWAPELCSACDCVFIDRNDPARVPQQILVVPSYTNCSLSADTLRFLSDLRIYTPRDCVREENAFITVSTTTSISGDEYGNRFAASTGSRDADADGPYIINPRRMLRIVIARFSWTPQDLSTRYNADCRRSERSRECKGIDYELPHTGQFVFAAEDALPTTKIRASSFASPHRLVQLNQAHLYSKSMKEKLIPERLDRRQDAGFFKALRWSEDGVANSTCSRLMASYLAHVESNSYFMDGGESETYHSALFFLLSNGSVTDPTNSSRQVTTSGIPTNSLEYVRLKGDIQLSEIRVSIPQEPFVVALTGCLSLILVAVVVLIVPSRRLEYFPKEKSQAAKYIAIRNRDRYPDALYRKSLLFPATHEALAAEDFAIDELQLTHKASRERRIILS